VAYRGQGDEKGQEMNTEKTPYTQVKDKAYFLLRILQFVNFFS